MVRRNPRLHSPIAPAHMVGRPPAPDCGPASEPLLSGKSFEPRAADNRAIGPLTIRCAAVRQKRALTIPTLPATALRTRVRHGLDRAVRSANRGRGSRRRRRRERGRSQHRHLGGERPCAHADCQVNRQGIRAVLEAAKCYVSGPERNLRRPPLARRRYRRQLSGLLRADGAK